jgi:acyl-CoA thioesterase FadM
VVQGLHDDHSLSISHAGDWLLLVIGRQTQGCDIEPVLPRALHQWEALLGPHCRLRARIPEKQDDVAYTQIWCAAEAALKATQSASGELVLHQSGPEWVSFSLVGRPSILILTYVLALEGKAYVMAVLLYRSAVLYDPSISQLGTRTVDGKTSFWRKHPVNFNVCGNPDGSVYFSHYFKMMGEAREDAIRPILAELVRLLKAGDYALFTTQVSIRVTSGFSIGDVVEVTVLALRRTSSSSFDLGFEWRLANGPQHVVARAEMSLTWACVSASAGAGPATQPHPLPSVLQNFLESVGYASPASSGDATEHAWFSPCKHSPLRSDATFSTGFFHSNPVKNVYFSHYSEWQGALRDALLHTHAREAFLKPSALGPFSARITFLRDAQPFDPITTAVWLEPQKGNELHFYFEHRSAAGLLATAEHRVSCSKELHQRIQSAFSGLSRLEEATLTSL